MLMKMVYWRILDDEQSIPFDVEGHCQVLNSNELASVKCNQRVRQAASVDSYEYLKLVVNNEADVEVLPTVNLNRNDATAADSDSSNQ